jgi:hypothetical protein
LFFISIFDRILREETTYKNSSNSGGDALPGVFEDANSNLFCNVFFALRKVLIPIITNALCSLSSHFMKRMNIFLLLLITGVRGTAIGTIKQARITSAASSIWLYNQSSWSQCMCYSLQYPPVVAFNSYASNSSCELFQNLSSIPFQVINDPNVIVYLLQPIQPYIPCCSNLTWLLSQMKSVYKTVSVPSITGIGLDTDRKRLGTVGSATLQLVSADSVTFLNLSTSLPTGSQPITYHHNLFYVGIFPAILNQFYIYSALNLTRVGNINFTQGSPQRIIWLYNETLVCILIQIYSGSYSIVNFYNWPSNTLNQSIQIRITNAYGLGKAPNDDTFVYIADGSRNGSVWRLKTSSPYNFTLFVPGSSINESPTAVTVDNCNRLWVVFYGYGVRIYDLSLAVILATWNLKTTYPQLYDLALTDQYLLYLADKNSSKLARYGSALQCTN